MSTDAEMEQYGPAAVYLRKPERERIEAQATPFDAKTAYFVVDADEMYLKGKLVKKEGGKATVETDSGKVGDSLFLPSFCRRMPFCPWVFIWNNILVFSEIYFYHCILNLVIRWTTMASICMFLFEMISK